MYRLLTLICLAMLSLSMLAHAAKDEKKAAPSFSPGAKVELQLAVHCPKGWAHNPNVPLSISFDEDYLKQAPFKVSQPSFTTKFEGHPHSVTVRIPITLSGKVPDGELSIPVKIDAFICTDNAEICAMASEDARLRVMVKAKAEKGSKDQAQGKGSLPLSYELAIPEV